MLETIFSSTFFNSVHSLVNEIVRVGTVFLTLGVIVYFIAMVFRLTTLREDGGATVAHIFFVVFATIGLVTYEIWAVWLGKLFVFLARSIFDLEGGNIMSDYLGAFFANSDGSGLRLSLFNLLSLETLSSLSYMLVMIVYEIFVIIQVIVQIFFYLLGPLAIVISLFPNFRGVFVTWLSNFVAVNFWSVLAAILFRLVKVLTSSPAFQTAIQNGDKGILWETFILGVIIAVTLVLIPKFSSGIFSRAGASADLGTYGVGITAGVVLSTVWKRLRATTTTVTHGVSATTAASVVGGARALSASPVATSTRALAEGAGNGAGSPFGGSVQPNA
jgi:hypothetical protein